MARKDTTRRQAARAPKMTPEARRSLLLAKSVEAFASLGIDVAKHQDVAQAANVARPTVFTYFPTREALVSDVLAHVQEKLIQQVFSDFKAANDNPRERLIKSGHLMLLFANQWPDHSKVWLMWTMHSASVIQAQYRVFEQTILDMLGEMIEEGANSQLKPEEVRDRARILHCATMTLVRETLRGTQQHELDQFILCAVDLVLR